ncbi:MAG TPA: hybrid sensor histidine kinase/response regulator [Polyangiaceae bacterium]
MEPDISTTKRRAPSTTEDPDILVVDDTPANLQLLSGMLKEVGYRVRVVPSGALALASAANRVPDLVLLDINMPNMDGYEVCRRMKEDPELSRVPVLFISALSEPIDKVKAFSSGGVDYVTKPFQVEEVAARVRTHLENRRLQRALEERASELEEKNAELRVSEKLRENLVHMIVHDMRTPLSGLLASLQFLEEDALAQLRKENREDLEHAAYAGRKLAQMIDDMLDISRLEAGKLDVKPTRVRVGELFDRALDSLGGLLKGRHLRVTAPLELELYGDAELLRRVLVNLLGNALKFTPEDGRIDLAAERAEGSVRVTVTDDGPGIEARYHGQIFDKFEQVNARKDGTLRSTGLGLTFCKLAVEAHRGRIGVESTPGKGSIFWFELANGP